jgi:hypothetical protein
MTLLMVQVYLVGVKNGALADSNFKTPGSARGRDWKSGRSLMGGGGPR